MICILGMKEKELRENSDCALCGEKLLAGVFGVAFFKVSCQFHIADMKAMQRQQGLGMMLGHGGLAMAMGPDEDMTKKIWDHDLMICSECMESESPLEKLLNKFQDKNSD